jgi:hypothetical protein
MAKKLSRNRVKFKRKKKLPVAGRDIGWNGKPGVPDKPEEVSACAVRYGDQYPVHLKRHRRAMGSLDAILRVISGEHGQVTINLWAREMGVEEAIAMLGRIADAAAREVDRISKASGKDLAECRMAFKMSSAEHDTVQGPSLTPLF